MGQQKSVAELQALEATGGYALRPQQQAAVSDGEIRVDFSGGLVTAIDAQYIGPNECQALENANVRSGNPLLDQRYIQAFDQTGQGAVVSVQGSGWGRYGTGTLSNQYVAVVDGKLYEYDLTAGILSRTQAATGLPAGAFFFQQYQNYLYGVNSTGGFYRKLLGSGVNGHGDFTGVTSPAAPAAAPTAPDDPGSSVQSSWAGATASFVSGAGSIAYQSGADGYQLTWTQSQAANSVFEFEVVYKNAAPDRRPDWSHHDILTHQIRFGTGFSLAKISVWNGQTYVDIVPWKSWVAGVSGLTGSQSDRMQKMARGDRTSVTKIKYTIAVPSNGGSMNINSPRAGGVWLSLDDATNVPVNTDPPQAPLIYEYTYANTLSNLESPPSPALTIAATAQNPFGEWRDVTGVTTGQAGIDRVNFYRRIDAGGVSTRYLLGHVTNAGTPTVVDNNSVNDVKALTIYTPAIIPTANLTAIGAWLNRLVLATGNTVYISRDQQPLQFEPLTGPFDTTNQARGLTYNCDDNHAETVLGISGQNSLYIVTDQSVRVLFGTTPDNWRNMKMPDSEGACGPRAWAPYRGGVLVFTSSGRLMWHHIDLFAMTYDHPLVPEEVSVKVRARIGNAGIAEMATSDCVVCVRPDQQIEVRNQAGRYYVLDIDGKWRRGTYTKGTQSALFISGLPLRWMGIDGNLYQGGSDLYVSDGGLIGGDGTAVEFSATSKLFLIDRASVQHLNWGSTPDSNAGPNEPYPRAILYTTFNPAGTAIAKIWGRRDTPIPVVNAGQAISLQVFGNKDTVIQETRLHMVPASSQRHK